MKQLTYGNIVFIVFSFIILSVAHAEFLLDEKWSFNFNNVSILDAFDTITKETGIEFVVRNKSPQPIMVSYSDKNQSIMKIYRDLLKHVNYASSWNYSVDGKLQSINITIISHVNGISNISVSGGNKPENIKNHENKMDTKPIKQEGSNNPLNSKTLKDLKSKSPKPPVAPKIAGLNSPPSPPGD